MEINWTEIVISIIGIVVTGILIPAVKNLIEFIKQKKEVLKEQLGAEKYAVLEKWTRLFCISAEVVYEGSGLGNIKSDAVIDWLIQKGVVTESDRELVKTAIVGICEQLTKEGLINGSKDTTITAEACKSKKKA